MIARPVVQFHGLPVRKERAKGLFSESSRRVKSMKVKVNGQILKVSAIVREKDGSLVAYRNKKIVASVSNPKDMEIIVNVREL